jgi:hypothetical protein
MKKGVIGLFFAAMFAGIVSAQTAIPSNFLENILNAFSGSTADFLRNIISPEILFGVLIFLVVFAIVNHISIFKKPEWLPIPLSIVIALLSAAFIPADFIKPLLNQYTAIGVTITLLVPFVLIFYFLKEIAPHNQFVQKAVWGVFFAITAFNAWINWSAADSSITHFLYFIIIIGSIVMFAFGRRILAMIWREELQGAVEKYDEIAALIAQNQIAEAEKALRTVGSQLPPGTQARLAQQIQTMKESSR